MEQNASLFLVQQAYFIDFLSALLSEISGREGCAGYTTAVGIVMNVEDRIAKLFATAISTAPPLIIAKPFFKEVKLLRILSIFYAPERPRSIISIEKKLNISEYFNGEVSNLDILQQFPVRRLQEYFDFFQSLCVICPENHPDYYYISLIVKELKVQQSELEERNRYISLYCDVKSSFASFARIPPRFIHSQQQRLGECRISFLCKNWLASAQEGTAIITKFELILINQDNVYVSFVPLPQLTIGENDQGIFYFSYPGHRDSLTGTETLLFTVYDEEYKITLFCANEEEYEEISALFMMFRELPSLYPAVHPMDHEEEIATHISIAQYREGMKVKYVAIGAALLGKGGVPRHSSLKRQELYFYGSDAVLWVVRELKVEECIAEQIVGHLFAMGLFRPFSAAVDSETFENNSSSRYSVCSPLELNSICVWDRAAIHPVLLSCELLRRLLALYQYYSPLFRVIDASILEIFYLDPAFQHFQRLCTQLQRANLAILDNTQRIVFFINIYNTLALHTYAQFPKYTKKKIMIRKLSFFKKAAYSIGGNRYCLWDLDHAMLRARSSGPAGILSGILLPKVKKDDPRHCFLVHEPNPIVNFVLYAGTSDSPRVAVYTDDELEEQLEASAIQFALEHFRVEEHSKYTIFRLPKILQWFYKDFGPTEKAMAEKVASFLPSHKRQLVLHALQQDKLTVKYEEYHWSYKYPLTM